MLSVTGLSQIGRSNVISCDRFFYAVDPFSGDSFPTPFYCATNVEVDRAVALAHQAFLSFSEMNIRLRAHFMECIAEKTEGYQNDLMHWFCQESALPENRAKAELSRSCFQFRSYAAALRSGLVLDVRIDKRDVLRLPSPQPDLRKMNVALGPVVVFGASNFPFAYSVLGGDVASAFAAGCPVIVKAHPMHPHTSELSAQIIAEAIEECGLPEGVFSHLFDDGYAVGEQLVLHPGIKAVGFTGSIRGGEALMRLVQKRAEPVPVFAEMGSSNPMFFSEMALANQAETIARQVVDSISLNAGQFCTSPGLLFVVKSEASDHFLKRLRDQLCSVPEQTMLHPGIFDQYRRRVTAQLELAAVLLNGRRQGYAIQPGLCLVSSDEFVSNAVLQEEVFGSFATVVHCSSRTELETCISVLKGQLTGSIYMEPEDDFVELVSLVRQKVGRLIFNGVPTGVAVATAMQHGGPYPSSSVPSSTAVGADAVKRFMRPVTYQNCREEWLPEALKDANSLQILRFVNGNYTR